MSSNADTATNPIRRSSRKRKSTSHHDLEDGVVNSFPSSSDATKTTHRSCANFSPELRREFYARAKELKQDTTVTYVWKVMSEETVKDDQGNDMLIDSITGQPLKKYPMARKAMGRLFDTLDEEIQKHVNKKPLFYRHVKPQDLPLFMFVDKRAFNGPQTFDIVEVQRCREMSNCCTYKDLSNNLFFYCFLDIGIPMLAKLVQEGSLRAPLVAAGRKKRREEAMATIRSSGGTAAPKPVNNDNDTLCPPSSRLLVSTHMKEQEASTDRTVDIARDVCFFIDDHYSKIFSAQEGGLGLTNYLIWKEMGHKFAALYVKYCRNLHWKQKDKRLREADTQDHDGDLQKAFQAHIQHYKYWLFVYRWECQFRLCPAAAAAGHLEAFQFAMNHGCFFGNTAVCQAVTAGHYNIVKLCCQRKMKLGERDSTVTQEAAKVGNLAIMKLLHSHHWPWDANTFKTALLCQRHDVVEYLCKTNCPRPDNPYTIAPSDMKIMLLLEKYNI